MRFAGADRGGGRVGSPWGFGRFYSLATRWRDDAERFMRHGSQDQSTLMLRMVEDLEAELRAEADELLTLREASEYSGYSEDHLGRMMRQGKLTNHGRKGAPRLRRAELVIKGTEGANRMSDRYDVDRLFRDIANSKRG